MDDGLHAISQIPSIIIQLGCVLALVLFLLFGFFFFNSAFSEQSCSFFCEQVAEGVRAGPGNLHPCYGSH